MLIPTFINSFLLSTCAHTWNHSFFFFFFSIFYEIWMRSKFMKNLFLNFSLFYFFLKISFLFFFGINQTVIKTPWMLLNFIEDSLWYLPFLLVHFIGWTNRIFVDAVDKVTLLHQLDDQNNFFVNNDFIIIVIQSLVELYCYMIKS